jgi:hypothetical protein
MWRVWTLVAALTAAGCGVEHESSTSPDAGIPEPTLPTSRPQAAPVPSWMERLPDVAPAAKTGDLVWACVAGPTSVPHLGVYTVEGVYDGLYSLKDRTGHRVDAVPPALVHATKKTKIDSGDVVLFASPATPAFLGRVAELVPGGDIEVWYDWGGKTRKVSVEHVQRPVKGIRPLAYVAFPKASEPSRGLVVALDDRRVFVRTASGHVEEHPRPAIKSLPFPARKVGVGSRVRAFRWATGIQTGTVGAIIEPGLRYRVDLDGNKPSQEYFFTMVFRP